MPARIAYLVLSHGDPAGVARLADRLLRGDPHCRVVVRHDADGPPLAGLPEDSRLDLGRSPRPGGWGGWGLVQATLDGLTEVRRDHDPDWVVLLSGADYPTRSPAAIRDELAADESDARLTVLHRIGARPGAGELRWWHARYHFRWFALPHTPGRLPARGTEIRLSLERRLNAAQPLVRLWSLPRGGGTRIGLRRRTPFGAAYPLWGAYQWLALSRHGLATVLDDIAARPDLVALYRRSVIPDESLIQTVAINHPAIRVGEPNLTFQRPSGAGNAHAADLGLADLDAIVASGRPFARKLHPVDGVALMDALDARHHAAGGP